MVDICTCRCHTATPPPRGRAGATTAHTRANFQGLKKIGGGVQQWGLKGADAERKTGIKDPIQLGFDSFFFLKIGTRQGHTRANFWLHRAIWRCLGGANAYTFGPTTAVNGF